MFKNLKRLTETDISHYLNDDDFLNLLNKFGGGRDSVSYDDIDAISVMHHGLFRESAVIIYSKFSPELKLERNIPFVCHLEGVSSTTYKDLKPYTPNKLTGFKRYYISSYSIEVFNKENNSNELHDIKHLLFQIGLMEFDKKYGKYYLTNEYPELRKVSNDKKYPHDLLYPMRELSRYVYTDHFYFDNFRLKHKFPDKIVF